MLDSFQSTPIQKLQENLGDNQFYMKRDDLLPFSFGGNKARKAFFFFKEFKKEMADCFVTYGSSSSNHCRVIANVAAIHNIPCYIISPIEQSVVTGNSKLVKLLSAVLIKCAIPDVSETIERTLKELKMKGFSPYFIPGGGHGDLGTHAYVKAYEEILKYEDEMQLHFDYIFHTSGTGTTQAGLVCGKIIHNSIREIVGISNARRNPHGEDVVSQSVRSYLKNFHSLENIHEELQFIDEYVLDGYGDYNNKIVDVVYETMRKEGIPLDVTYTGKAFWGMKEYIKKHKITNKKILFVHTGGTPLFFDSLGDLTHDK